MSRRAAGGWEEKVQEPSRNSIIPADPHCGSQGLPLPATQALCPKLAKVHQQSSHLLLRDLFLSRCEKTPPFWLSFLGFFSISCSFLHLMAPDCPMPHPTAAILQRKYDLAFLWLFCNLLPLQPLLSDLSHPEPGVGLSRKALSGTSIHSTVRKHSPTLI